MKKAGKAARSPDWKYNWPTTGNLRAWLLCHVEKCKARRELEGDDPQAELPIKLLAEHGHPKEALRLVNEFLKPHMATRSLDVVSMAETGAEICLDQHDLKGCEKYLNMALAADRFVTRKCDVGFPARSVRRFRVLNGLLDPAEAEDEKQRWEATFTRARRHCQDAIRLGDRKRARQELAEMHQAAKRNKSGFFRALEMQVVVKAAAELGDPALVRHYMAGLSKADRNEVLDHTLLSEIGMRDEAIAAALRSIKQETKELVEMDNPNIHFPVMSICDALKFLIAEGQKDVAHKALTSVVKTSSKWTTLGPNFTTSSVLSMFAEVVAQLEGPEQARMLLDQAREHAGKGRRSDFQQGARFSAIATEAKIGEVESALEKARKLRSPTVRRFTVATLLAKAGRWKEIPAVCSEAATPEEAADLALRVGSVIRLPDG